METDHFKGLDDTYSQNMERGYRGNKIGEKRYLLEPYIVQTHAIGPPWGWSRTLTFQKNVLFASLKAL